MVSDELSIREVAWLSKKWFETSPEAPTDSHTFAYRCGHLNENIANKFRTWLRFQWSPEASKLVLISVNKFVYIESGFIENIIKEAHWGGIKPQTYIFFLEYQQKSNWGRGDGMPSRSSKKESELYFCLGCHSFLWLCWQTVCDVSVAQAMIIPQRFSNRHKNTFIVDFFQGKSLAHQQSGTF